MSNGRPLALLGAAALLWPLAALLFAACAGDGSAPRGERVLRELARVSTLERGQPLLVFVYTDG